MAPITTADKLKEKWVAQDGNIRTERQFVMEGWKGSKHVVHAWITFNLKPEIAAHLVKLHNATLSS